MNWGKVGLFAGGVLFGTAGIKILTSRDAKEGLRFHDRGGAARQGSPS